MQCPRCKQEMVYISRCLDPKTNIETYPSYYTCTWCEAAVADPNSVRPDIIIEISTQCSPPNSPQVYERFTDQFAGDYPRINMDDNSWAKMDEEDSM